MWFGRWAGLGAQPRRMGMRRPSRLVDIYRNREGEGLTRERFTARVDRDGLLVEHEEPRRAGAAVPQACDCDAFADLLARAMVGIPT